MAGHKHGNNNAYCQDNEISWFNWDRDQKQSQFLGSREN